MLHAITPPRPDEDAPAQPVAQDYLLFVAGGQQFCLPVGCIRELRAWSKPTPLPHAPPALLGVINLRGTVLPVLDLASELELPFTGDPSPRPVIMVIGVGNRRTGLRLDSVRDIQSLPPDRIEPPPPGIAPGCLTGIALVEGTILRILDPALLMPAPATDGP